MKGGQNRIDMVGQQFGCLIVVAYADTTGRRARWNCKCKCGNATIVTGKDLRLGHTRSCGCRARAWAHGQHQNRFYYTYQGMMKRCFNQKHVAYPRYGGRGIKVCDEWVSDITNFIKWCESQEPIRKSYTLDRRDNSLGYSPGNCRFVSKSEQQRNSRRYQ